MEANISPKDAKVPSKTGAATSSGGQDQPDRVGAAAPEPQLSAADPVTSAKSADSVKSRADEQECQEPVIVATKVIPCGWLDNTLPPPRCPPPASEPPTGDSLATQPAKASPSR